MEYWKQIVGFPGYQISSEGRVKREYNRKEVHSRSGFTGDLITIIREYPEAILEQGTRSRFGYAYT